MVTLHRLALLSGDQHLHHAELLILLRTHGHKLLALHPARLRLGAVAHLSSPFLLELLEVIKFAAHVSHLHRLCLLIVDTLDAATFHQLRSLVKQSANV